MANKLVAKTLLSSAQSLAASFQTAVTNIENCDKIAWTISTSGVSDNTGTFSAQVRNSNLNANQIGDWIDVAFTPVPVLANTNSTFTCVITETAWSEARLKFVASGVVPNGTAQIWVKAERKG